MKPIMYNQKWFSYNEYPIDYFELLFLYYATCGRSIPATYYNLDLSNSVCDKTILDAGSFEKVGSLSGLLWKKILLLQVFGIETLQLNFTADERGFGKFDQQTSLWIPSVYQINPMVHDFVLFDHIEDRENQFLAKSPLFEVVNVEKASNTEKTFWKVYLKVSYITKDNIDKQLSGNYSFIDYEKKIYKTSDMVTMTKLAEKNREIAADQFFDEHSGLYLEKEQMLTRSPTRSPISIGTRCRRMRI